MTYDSWKARNPADEELGGDPHLSAVQQSEGNRMTGPHWESTETVKADADARCFICRGSGWYWGWNEVHEAVMLRCPCVAAAEQREGNRMTKMPFVCKANTPWTPSIGTPVVHADAREIGEQRDGWPAGDIVTYECPHCGHRWEAELPQ